jgi:hypothetical protein
MAASELSSNQITHFYIEKKSTCEMIRLVDVLLEIETVGHCIYRGTLHPGTAHENSLRRYGK